MLTRLPHRVIIESETRTAFEGGAYTTSWTTSSIEWANVQTMAKDETYTDEKKQQVTKYKVIMRNKDSLTNKKRLKFNNNILVIETVTNPTNRARMMEVVCRLENV